MAECRITVQKRYIAVSLLSCHVQHCTAAFTGNARALWQFVIKFPTPVRWRLTFSLLTVYSLLFCLPCAVLFIFSSEKDHPSISECCFCSIPVRVLLSVVHYCNRSCYSHFLKVKWCNCTLLTPLSLPLSTLCAWGTRGVVFPLFLQDSWGITLSNWDYQAKEELPGVPQIWSPRVPCPELKSLQQQQRHGSNRTGKMCCLSPWCWLEEGLWGRFKVIS